MLSLPLAAGFAAAIVSTSFISGIFGMAGGMILMEILLAFMPLAPAMVLHGLVQMASSGWRAWQWRADIDWRIVAHYAAKRGHRNRWRSAQPRSGQQVDSPNYHRPDALRRAGASTSVRARPAAPRP